MLKKKYKTILVVFFLIIFLSILFITRPKNYTKTYKVNNVDITEQFNKKTKYYTFTFTLNTETFISKISHKYINHKKLIKSLTINQDDNTTCLIPESNYLNTYPICKQNDEYLSFYLINNKDLVPNDYYQDLSSEPKTYNKLTLYNLNNHKYLIWNYKGAYIINNNKNTEVNLFNTDIYSIPLATQVKNYFIIPNYEDQYNFNKFYLIDINNYKVRELNLKDPISYESYILGNDNKHFYLVDKKNQKEYEIYPKRLLIQNIINNNLGRIIENGNWTSISLNKLVTTENTFTYPIEITYTIENNKLYEVVDNQKTLVTNNPVKKIIKVIDNTVYYISEDKLYSFNDYEGEVLILQNFEWNFNYDNMIFIY